MWNAKGYFKILFYYRKNAFGSKMIEKKVIGSELKKKKLRKKIWKGI